MQDSLEYFDGVEVEILRKQHKMLDLEKVGETWVVRRLVSDGLVKELSNAKV